MTFDKNDLMEKIKNALRTEVTTISFDTWINPLNIRSIDGNHIIFTAVSPYQKDFIDTKYKPLLLNTLRFLTNRDWEYSVVDLEAEAEKGILEVFEESNVDAVSLDARAVNSGLNPKYTFETFVVGENNKLAHAAALAVGNEPR